MVQIMTLYRQLVIFTFLLFFVLFAGTWLAKLESTRSFLVDQLESHAQDTATSLGLSMSQLAKLIRHERHALAFVNDAREARGLHRLK